VRVTIPKLLGLGFSVMLGVYVFVVAPQMPGKIVSHIGHAIGGGQARALTARSAPLFPARGKKFVGIMTNSGPYDFTQLDRFTKAVGHQPSVYEFAQGWAVNQFDRSAIDKVANRGMLPLISWEPWDYQHRSTIESRAGDQPAYSLSHIINGDYDGYIRSWAKGVKSLPYTIALRFAHEMNGFWYPWGVLTNGNSVGEYVRAWRHVHDIFTRIGAKNVIWVWSPNIIWNDSTNLAELYPGNRYVDWIGLSGYYGTPGTLDYKSFNATFARTIAKLRKFTSKPLVITETGATNVSGLMAHWITQMFRQLPAHTEIIGVIWFEAFRVIDWQVADHPAAASAFRAGFGSSLYRVEWRPGMRPLLTVPLRGRTAGASRRPSHSAAPGSAATSPWPAATTSPAKPTEPAPTASNSPARRQPSKSPTPSRTALAKPTPTPFTTPTHHRTLP
jgi:mannan endo-1,4-beta-mannosidase